MAADEKWYFTKQQLANSPSRRCGLDADKELSYRQQAANFIQDMGQRLKVTQLCINTAIVYMHRFYVFHSFTQFHRNSMAAASLFLAAKVEEQPRKLEHVITVAHWCLYREEPKLDTKSEQYLEQAQELVFNENVLLQTLGFDVAIDHPHTHVVRCCHLVRANKELAQTSYFMASNSLHLTTMCLQYKPTVVACFCIHLACKWSNWEIPQSSEGKDWFTYVDASVSLEQLEQLTAEFLLIFDKCPSRLKKMSGKKDDSYGFMAHNLSGMQMDQEPRKGRPIFPGGVRQGAPGQSQEGSTGSSSQQQARQSVPDDAKKAHHGPPRVDYREYKEKKAREAAAAAAAAGGVVNKDNKPSPAPHPQQGRQQPPQHHLAKRDLTKREMMARENAKREAIKQEAGRRDPSNLQQRPTDAPNQHHSNQDQKRPRDVPDSAIAGSSSNLQHSDSAVNILQQKRPEGHHLSTDPSRRSRETSDLPTSIPSHHHHHHHHPDQARRDKERPETSTSNHHSHPSMNQLKRPRDGSDVAPLVHQVSQPKRPREGTDPMMNILDSTKRPREPTDSSSIFSTVKSEPNLQSSSSDVSQHSDRHHPTDSKHLGAISKYPADIKSQPPGPHSTFNEVRQSKSMPQTSLSASQRHFNHSRHSRPQDGNTVSKNYEQDQQRKLILDKRDSPVFPKPQQDSHSLRPNQSVLGKSPVPSFPHSKSPLELSKLTEVRSRSPVVSGNLEVDKKVTATPDVSKRMADIFSRPEGHLFSPDDDREDSSLNLDVSLPDLLPTKFETKPQKPSPSVKSKQRTTPDKARESLLAPPTFVLPSSPTSPVTPGKSALPTTPTSDRKRKRTQSSSSSEPELVPVVRKLEDIPGFNAIIKDSGMGIKLSGGRVSDHSLPSTPGKDNPSPINVKHEPLDVKPMTELAKIESKELRHSFTSLAAESISTDHVLLKSESTVAEVINAPQIMPSIFEPLPTTGVEKLAEPQRNAEESTSGAGEHHRKKKKEKHGKKDKDKDRNRDEKKHKHKKKDREKSREDKNAEPVPSAPIKLTIHKDKLANFSQENKSSPLSQDTTLKIKIPKERLKVESPPVASSSSTASSVAVGGLKIKIGKELISERRLESSPSEHTSSRKQRGNETTPARAPNTNTSRRNYNKQNGHQDRKVRGAYNRGRGRAPPMHQPMPPPTYPHQYYPYPPPPPMYMYPPEAQHLYGYYPPQPAMYQQYPPPPLPMGTDFQKPPPPPLPDGPPPTVPPPPPPLE